MRFVVEGRPATKKNSRRLMRMGKRLVLRQSAQAEDWENGAALQLKAQWSGLARTARAVCVDSATWWVPGVALTGPMNLRALVYRDRAVGDLGNYLAAVCDALEKAGVVANDRFILGFDGSRLLIDRKRPRVEIDLSPLIESEAA